MIHQFNYKPVVEYITDKSEKIPRELFINYNQRTSRLMVPYIPEFTTMGIEVEFERLTKFGMVDDAVIEVANLISNANCYVKHDGSLRNGYELVSHPRTMKSWFNSHKEFDKLFREMRKLGLRSHTGGRCGLHVHIGLQSFINDMHVIRLINFIHNNPSFMFKVSGRTDVLWVQKYCKLANPVDILWYFYTRNVYPFTEKQLLTRNPYTTWKGHCAIQGRMNPVGHHMAVSITEGTVEVRIFRGTLNTEKIYAIFEFLLALIGFTDYNRSIRPKATDFIDYVKSFGTSSLVWEKIFSKLDYDGKEKQAPRIPGDLTTSITTTQRINKVVTTRNASFGLRRR